MINTGVNMMGMPGVNPAQGAAQAPQQQPMGPVQAPQTDFMTNGVGGPPLDPTRAHAAGDLQSTQKPDAVGKPSENFLQKIGVDLSGPFQQTGQRANELMGRMQDYVGKVKSGELDPKSPEAQQFNMEMSMDLLKLQVESGRAAFQVELAAKVIEHGTSATKTVMQTQV